MKRLTRLLFVGLAVVALVQPAAAADDPAVTEADRAQRTDVAHAEEFRAELGFDASRETVLRAVNDLAGYPDMTWGIPMTTAEADEMQRRIDVMHAVHPVVRAAQQDPTWAGWWIDQHDGGTPVLLFAADSAGKRAELQKAAPSTVKYRVERASRSLRELEAVQGAVSGQAAELRSQGVPVTGASIRVRTNEVIIDVAPSSLTASRAKIRGAFGDVTVRGSEEAEADYCPETGCLPLKGGIGFTDQNGNWPCTTGYLARRTDTSPDRLVVVTAGHCIKYGTANDPYKHGSSNIGSSLSVGGTVHVYFSRSNADVGVIAPSTIPTYRNRILVDESPETTVSVETALSWDLQAEGMAVCRMGKTTGRQCGTIRIRDDDRYSEVTGYAINLIEGVVVYSRDANGGDRGGPMFYTRINSSGSTYAVLLGTHVHSQDAYAPTGGLGWYSPWDRGISQLQSTFPTLRLTPCLTNSCGL